MEKVTIFPDKRRTVWGILYLLFQLLVLPILLGWLNVALGLSLNESKLNLLYYTINFAVLVGIFWRFLGISLQRAVENIGVVLSAALLGFLACRFSSTVLGVFTCYFYPDFVNVNDANIATMAQGEFPMWAFATVVLVPPAEELLFRGVLFGGLCSRNKILAWVVSVLGFALVHVLGYVGVYSWDLLLICALQYLPAGICLAAAYHFSGNILAPILMHVVINAIAMLSMTVM
jgi:membrane protease YdiL (CAAX protease family)